MTDEKKKKVKRYVAIVIALVLATGALAFSVWRFAVTIKKKIDSKNESNEPRITATTDTRGIQPTLDYTDNGAIADDVILTNQITFDRGGDGVFLLKVEDSVYRDVADNIGYCLASGGGFASIQLYIADTWTLNSSDFPTVPALTDSVWSKICCDLGDVTVTLPGGDLAFNVIKGSNPYVSFGSGYAVDEEYLPRSTEELNHYVMFAVVPLRYKGGDSWQYFRTTFYRMSDLFAMLVIGNGGGSTGGYTEADLEAARQQAVADYVKSDLYKHELQEKYDNGHDVGYSEGFTNGTREVLDSDEYKNGLQAKYDEGYAKGTEDYDRYGAQRYNDGLRDGRSRAQNDINTGKDLFFGILDAPFTLIRNIFNFEILGINISAVIFFILSVLLIGFVIRKIKG